MRCIETDRFEKNYNYAMHQNTPKSTSLPGRLDSDREEIDMESSGEVVYAL
jgi:hypothetical protein